MKTPQFWLVTALLCISTLAPAQGPCLKPPSDMIAWWRGEGNGYDAWGLQDGAVIGNVGFAPGMSGKAFTFSGVGDEYVSLPADVFPLPTEGTAAMPFSIELWFRTSQGGVILGQQDVTPFAIPDKGYVPALYVGTNGLLYAHVFWGLDDVLATTNAVNDGQWHHVAVTYDGLQEILYLNGQLIAWTECSQFGYATNYQYQIGTAYTGGWEGTSGLWFPFNGQIDEVSLYGRRLTHEEVIAIYQAGSGGKCGGPILRHRYSFNQPAGTSRVPDSVRGADGTLLFASPNAPYTNGVPDGSGFTGDGQLDLAGENGFVQLRQHMASWLLKMTVECWVTWDGPSTSSWQRIFDFGYNDRGTNASGSGTNYLILSPSIGGFEVLGFQETTVNPFGQQVDPRSLILSAGRQMPIGRELHMALTYDPEGGRSELFIDGELVASVSGKDLNPLKVFADHNCWLGRSQWQRDPHFNGRYNEFRLWEGILTSKEMAEHAAAGPDQDFTPALSPYLSMTRTSAGIDLSWPENASDYVLEWSPSPGTVPWATVSQIPSKLNGQNRVSLLFQEGSAYYRLRK